MRALQGIDLIETQILPTVFEPGGRGFKSLRARHIINKLSTRSGPLSFCVGTM